MYKTFIVSTPSLSHIVLSSDNKIYAVTDIQTVAVDVFLKLKCTKVNISDLSTELQKGITDTAYQAKFDLYEYVKGAPGSEKSEKGDKPAKPVAAPKPAKKAVSKKAQAKGKK